MYKSHELRFAKPMAFIVASEKSIVLVVLSFIHIKKKRFFIVALVLEAVFQLLVLEKSRP